MATSEHTPAAKLVSFEAAAALEFDPVPINNGLVGMGWAELNNPYLVSLRIAAATCARTKAELVEMVKQLGGTTDDGGEIATLVKHFNDARELFEAWGGLINMADARLFSATCAATLADVVA